MNNQTEVMHCRDVFGVRREIKVTDVNEFLSPGAVLEQRLVRVNEQVYVRKFVSSEAGRREPRRYDLLDNEIRAGTRLGQVFAGRYPPELASLVAYNIDAEEPFVLLREYTGIPAAAVVSRFTDQERKQFEQSLLRALHLTDLAGVVHGAVTIDAVRWQQGKLQLVEFERAKRVGEPRLDGVVDARDDLVAAALLIRSLHVGPSRNGTRPDRTHDPERLRALLDPVFDNEVTQRPHAADLLRRLRADGSTPAFTDPEAQFAAGRDQFDRVSLGKRTALAPAAAPPAPPKRSGSSAKRLVMVLVLVAAVVLVAVIAGTVVLA